MELGLVGLGRMGGNMRERLRRAGHTVLGIRPKPGGPRCRQSAAMVAALTAPRAVWLMIPAGDADPVDRRGARRAPRRRRRGHRRRQLPLDRRSRSTPKYLGKHGIGYVDCGVSGGVWGLENGYGLMAGGIERRHRQADADLRRAPAGGAARRGIRPRRPGRSRTFRQDGAQRHRVRPHAGVRRGLRTAGRRRRSSTNVPGVLKAWSRGTVVRSWLLDLLVTALEEDSQLTRAQGVCRGLRRRPVDGGGSDRARRAGAGDLRGTVRAIRVPPGRLAVDEGRRGAAPAVRWSRGAAADEAGPSSGTGDVRRTHSDRRTASPVTAAAGQPGPTSGPGDVRT